MTGIKSRAIGVPLAVIGIAIFISSLGLEILEGAQIDLGIWQLTGAFLGLLLAVAGGMLVRHDRHIRINPGSILLITLSVLFSLFAAEIGMRYVHKAWPFEKEIVNAQNLPTDELPLRWHFYPKSTLKAYTLTEGEDPGCRVLIVGDSVTQGLDMDAIQSHLALENGYEGMPVSLIRMGNGGHTTYQELEFLRIIGLEVSPKLVVLGMVLNDVYYKYLHRPTSKRLLDSEPGAWLHHFNTNGFPGVLFANSYLAHDLAFRAQVLWKRLSGYPYFHFERQVDAYLAWKDYGWEKTGELLAEMQEMVSDSGAQLEAIIFPTIHQANESYLQQDEKYVMYPIQATRQILEKLNIPYLDLTGPVNSSGGVKLFKDWIHFNDKGNQIVAEEIAKYIKHSLHRGACHTQGRT